MDNRMLLTVKFTKGAKAKRRNKFAIKRYLTFARDAFMYIT